MTERPLHIVILGLSITSSWGNGHATTYRGLVRELVRRGHSVLFLERDVPWYAGNRDLMVPPYGRMALYQDLRELRSQHGAAVRDADVVMVGSYVPDGVAVGDWVLRTARGLCVFYDIDTPVTLAQVEQERCEYLARRQIARYGLYLSFTGGPLLERLEREFGSPCARPLYCSVDPELYFPEPQAAVPWDLGYMGTYSDDRQPVLERLLIQPARHWGGGRFSVVGPQYPATLTWPANVRRLEHLPPARHRAVYNAQRFTLNVTRAAMVAAGHSPSVRIFEAAACATPIISDPWDGLGSVLEIGSEIMVAQSAREVVEMLVDMDEHERSALGERARARVLREHTAAHRALEFEQHAGTVRAAISAA